jgi:hypothetical protein
MGRWRPIDCRGVGLELVAPRLARAEQEAALLQRRERGDGWRIGDLSGARDVSRRQRRIGMEHQDAVDARDCA